MGVTAAVVGAIAATGGAYQAKRQGDIAKGQAREQKAAALKLQEEEAKEREQAGMALKRRKSALTERGARPSILTSPLGVPGQAPTATKTLLGQ